MENSRKARPDKAGFTLVELVVVIAILGILAGVGAVAYGGYIEYTQKGLDRDSVGEIMHAVEVADYANPDLFGDSGGALVVLSNTGFKAAGGLEGSDIQAALGEALGDSGSMKLKYDKWNGTANLDVFKNLGSDPNSQARQYLETVKKNNLATAFAEDMPEYWNAFTDLVRMLDGDTTDKSGSDIKDKLSITDGEKNLIDKIAKYYSTKTSANPDFADETIKYWKHENVNTDANGMRGIDIVLARNYAFASFAKKKNLPPERLKELEEYMSGDGKYNVVVDITSENRTALTDDFWDSIIAQYTPEQQEADAQAYLFLMESAGEVRNNLINKYGEGEYDDDDFIDALNPYVGMVGNILSGKVDYDSIQELAGETGGEGNIVINVTKRNGILSFTVSPTDANPRTENNSSSGQSQKSTPNIKLPLAQESFTADVYLNLNDNKTCTVYLGDETYGHKLTNNENYNEPSIINNNNVFSFEGCTITAVSAGEGTLILSYATKPNRAHPDAKTFTYTINIHVSND